MYSSPTHHTESHTSRTSIGTAATSKRALPLRMTALSTLVTRRWRCGELALLSSLADGTRRAPAAPALASYGTRGTVQEWEISRCPGGDPRKKYTYSGLDSPGSGQ